MAVEEKPAVAEEAKGDTLVEPAAEDRHRDTHLRKAVAVGLQHKDNNKVKEKEKSAVGAAAEDKPQARKAVVLLAEVMLVYLDT